MLICEGYKMFLGTMKITHTGSKLYHEKSGIWLYKPDCDCWYCEGSSYPASVCDVVTDHDVYVTEICPHCENEVTLEWNVSKKGYQIFCPECGEKMLLCSMCDGSESGCCDWTKEYGCRMTSTSEDGLREEVK